MSSLKCKGNASGSGSVTIEAPNTSSTRTLTLPDADGTLARTADIPAAGADTNLSNLSATGEQKVAQAWVNFNGTGTVAIRDSYNVSSIADNGTGDYTVNYSSAFANANYAVVATCLAGTGSGNNGQFVSSYGSAGAAPAGSTRISVKYHTGSANDVDGISVAAFGDPS